MQTGGSCPKTGNSLKGFSKALVKARLEMGVLEGT